ncbi:MULTISPECIES: DUF896 domain-containing protein [Anaerotruncus]|uniref:DUF896 domain-containing protein n=1 Tax=Anaerotruncus TaxID=244127 RepID=UPI00082E1F97|nr:MULTISPECIES: DUF896 domain-containing protein [Anaerotruncus]RGX56918.1 DUF896 domain-containing protein [Anaerotruncus sp. AF02-27]
MQQKKIERINELTRLAGQRELTDAEKEERLALRQEYLAAIKASLRSSLDNTYLVDEKGNKTKLQKRRE